VDEKTREHFQHGRFACAVRSEKSDDSPSSIFEMKTATARSRSSWCRPVRSLDRSQRVRSLCDKCRVNLRLNRRSLNCGHGLRSTFTDRQSSVDLWRKLRDRCFRGGFFFSNASIFSTSASAVIAMLFFRSSGTEPCSMNSSGQPIARNRSIDLLRMKMFHYRATETVVENVVFDRRNDFDAAREKFQRSGVHRF